MAIKIDLRVPPCKPIPEITAFVQECEDAGFDGVGMLDSQMLERDVFVAMAHALMNTKTIKVASAVTNPVTRHPSVLASAAQTVSEIAPGRAQIWIGRGYSSANVVGIPPATVRQMRDSVVMMKELMAGNQVDFGKVSSRMRHGGGVTTPIYIAATGPRVMKVAGEVADGAVLMTGIHPNAVAEARELIAEGAKAAGRNPDDIETIFTCTTIIRDDLKEAREVAPDDGGAEIDGVHLRPLAEGRRPGLLGPGDPPGSLGPLPRRAPCGGLGESQRTVRFPARRRTGPALRHHGPDRFA